MNTIVEHLMTAFPKSMIKQRDAPGGKKVDYIEGGDITHRVLTSTHGIFDWHIVSLELIPGEQRSGKNGSYTTKSYWLCHGKLTIPGLGSRDGVGTQPSETEDSAKGADTDAFKRACMKFGVALDLYRDESVETIVTYASLIEQMKNTEVVKEVQRLCGLRKLKEPPMKELGRDGCVAWLLEQDAKEAVAL